MRNTVSLCMICKNEISNLGILLDQVCPILEQIVVVDTGSTDGTIELIKDKQLVYPNLELHHFEWVKDFSKARNFSFSLANQEYILFLDCDDQIDPVALKKFKDEFLTDTNVDCWILDYIYASFPDGTPQLVLGRERFVRRSLNPQWVGAIHETIAIHNFRQKNYSDLKVVHNRNGKIIDYNRNIDILATEFEKNPNDPRTAYYYGKELFDRVDPKGLEILKHYLNLDGKYWDDAVNAQFRLACDDLVNNRLDEVYNRASQIYILDTSRERAEYYWLMGSIEQKIKNYNSAIRWYKICLEVNPESPRVVNREYYSWNPIHRLSECYLEIGDIDNAITYYDRLHNLVGSDHINSLRNKIIAFFKPINGLIILDYLKLRGDSYHIERRPQHLGAFADGVIDDLYMDCFAEVLKPRGFYWHVSPMGFPDSSLCQTISEETYINSSNKGAVINNSIRCLSQAPTICIPNGDADFGPYRIRMRNLRNSLIKNGQRVVSSPNPDCIYISQRLDNKICKYNILDVCEWLPHSDYNEYGIKYADMVACSSPLLTELMKKKFPNKKVVCIEDHVDMVDREWL